MWYLIVIVELDLQVCSFSLEHADLTIISALFEPSSNSAGLSHGLLPYVDGHSYSIKYHLRKPQTDSPIPVINFFRAPYIPIKDAVDGFQF